MTWSIARMILISSFRFGSLSSSRTSRSRGFYSTASSHERLAAFGFTASIPGKWLPKVLLRGRVSWIVSPLIPVRSYPSGCCKCRTNLTLIVVTRLRSFPLHCIAVPPRRARGRDRSVVSSTTIERPRLAIVGAAALACSRCPTLSQPLKAAKSQNAVPLCRAAVSGN